jgi:hypothetical protein
MRVAVVETPRIEVAGNEVASGFPEKNGILGFL